MKKEYKKINLRDFRHNLTQLKDSLNAGQIYEVIDRGETLAYFIPPKYEVKIVKKKDRKQEEFKKIFLDVMGTIELKDEIKGETDYKKAYHKLLDKKYKHK